MNTSEKDLAPSPLHYVSTTYSELLGRDIKKFNYTQPNRANKHHIGAEWALLWDEMEWTKLLLPPMKAIIDNKHEA